LWTIQVPSGAPPGGSVVIVPTEKPSFVMSNDATSSDSQR
jgi:hypothetical protein